MLKKNLAAGIAATVGVFGAACALGADDGSTTVGGKMFGDFTWIDQKSDDVKQPPSGVGIDVKRFYIIVDHKFDDMWSANVTTDFNFSSVDNETQVFIKKAYLQATLSDAVVLRAGSADMPWIPYVEKLNGYRFVEKLLLDRLGFGNTADWGLNANGKLGSTADYSVSVVNGRGYKNPGRSKQMDVEGRVGFMPMEGVTLAAGFYSGKLGQKVENDPVGTRTADRFDAAAAYAKEGLRLGAEFFAAKNFRNVSLAGPEDKADGFSVWASYDFNPQWGVFARGDSAKPSKDLNPDLKDKYFNIGLVTHPRKNVDIAVAYKYEKVDGPGFVPTTEGAIGGATDGKRNEFGVWAQVGF